MPVSKNKIKYIRSLKVKKFRDEYRQFIAEGDKIVSDILRFNPTLVREVIATGEWLLKNKNKLDLRNSTFLTEVNQKEYDQITSLETPSGVMALFDIPENRADLSGIKGELTLALDGVQDPGNLGTIIRTASWFGIKQLFCSEDCADSYNPKVVQSSMGGVFYVNVIYTALGELLSKFNETAGVTVYGTFTDGKRIWDERLNDSSVIVFGNESKGISDSLLPYIHKKLTIPKYITPGSQNIESLNVASAVAIVCSAFRSGS